MSQVQTVIQLSGFTVRKVIELVSMNKKCESVIYLKKGNQLTNGKCLLSVLSFILVTREGERYQVVAEGKDEEDVIHNFIAFTKRMNGSYTLSLEK
ncbi:HPr family phosphocarrier protein [Bacillus sp. FJAT-45350]|uniref:HPr family phosphocarrier protein n=1 Tax=Bacillus sp. FJAT-45350 TaxID=2011014 RepID=UPI000BB6DA46|nr:HPr family phosphocarrier protein [Bacillus sp. FJAT-45350]